MGASGSEPPHVWWADFDKSGRVDFGDLAFFAPNFGKNRDDVQSGAQTLVFPLNFPDAWRGEAGGGQAEGEASDGDRISAGFDGAHSTPVLPWQWASAVDEAHAALQAETPPGLSGGTMGREARPAPLLRHESPVTLYSRSDNPVAAFVERPDRQFEDWEPLEDLLPSLAEPPTGRFSDGVLDPHEAFFSRIVS